MPHHDFNFENALTQQLAEARERLAQTLAETVDQELGKVQSQLNTEFAGVLERALQAHEYEEVERLRAEMLKLRTENERTLDELCVNNKSKLEELRAENERIREEQSQLHAEMSDLRTEKERRVQEQTLLHDEVVKLRAENTQFRSDCSQRVGQKMDQKAIGDEFARCVNVAEGATQKNIAELEGSLKKSVEEQLANNRAAEIFEFLKAANESLKAAEETAALMEAAETAAAQAEAAREIAPQIDTSNEKLAMQQHAEDVAQKRAAEEGEMQNNVVNKKVEEQKAEMDALQKSTNKEQTQEKNTVDVKESVEEKAQRMNGKTTDGVTPTMEEKKSVEVKEALEKKPQKENSNTRDGESTTSSANLANGVIDPVLAKNQKLTEEQIRKLTQKAWNAQPQDPEGGQQWIVIGGGERGGLIVRSGPELDSQLLAARLETGTSIEELDMIGNRLHYKRIRGDGPDWGWINIELRGNILIQRADAE